MTNLNLKPYTQPAPRILEPLDTTQHGNLKKKTSFNETVSFRTIYINPHPPKPSKISRLFKRLRNPSNHNVKLLITETVQPLAPKAEVQVHDKKSSVKPLPKTIRQAYKKSAINYDYTPILPAIPTAVLNPIKTQVDTLKSTRPERYTTLLQCLTDILEKNENLFTGCSNIKAERGALLKALNNHTQNPDVLKLFQLDISTLHTLAKNLLKARTLFNTLEEYSQELLEISDTLMESLTPQKNDEGGLKKALSMISLSSESSGASQENFYGTKKMVTPTNDSILDTADWLIESLEHTAQSILALIQDLKKKKHPLTSLSPIKLQAAPKEPKDEKEKITDIEKASIALFKTLDEKSNELIQASTTLEQHLYQNQHLNVN